MLFFGHGQLFSVHHKILKKGIIEQEKSFQFYIINFP